MSDKVVKRGDRVVYYTGGLEGEVVKVAVRDGDGLGLREVVLADRAALVFVHVKWDNGAPDLGPYPLGTPTSSVRLK